jgi:hypothetical protein
MITQLTGPYCGDGVTEANFGEQCDDGSNNGAACAYKGGSATTSNPCDLCSSTYTQITTGPFCGDGIVQSNFGETCDDGHADETTTCPPTTGCMKCHACVTMTFPEECMDLRMDGMETDIDCGALHVTASATRARSARVV